MPEKPMTCFTLKRSNDPDIPLPDSPAQRALWFSCRAACSFSLRAFLSCSKLCMRCSMMFVNMILKSFNMSKILDAVFVSKAMIMMIKFKFRLVYMDVKHQTNQTKPF